MIKKRMVLNTAGDGVWSDNACGVLVTEVALTHWTAELIVGFDTETWNVANEGLIYTDSRFLQEVQDLLNLYGLPGSEVTYSEQGLQGTDYVSFDASDAFVEAWYTKFTN